MGDVFMPDPSGGGRHKQRPLTPRELKAQAEFDWVTFVAQTCYDVWGKQELGPHDKPAEKTTRGRRA